MAAANLAGNPTNTTTAAPDETTIDYSGPRQSVGTLYIDKGVRAAFPDQGATQIDSFKYGDSLWGVTGKIIVKLENGELRDYFVKTVSLGDIGRTMCQGEFESLRAIHAAAPGICPEPYAWGKCEETAKETYFLLVQFREVAFQPASPIRLGAGIARLHRESKSPTGKFGFHIRTVHALIDQAVDFWDASWCNVFQSHLKHALELASPILGWPELDLVGKLTVEHVVPRLLLPLQENGRELKPSLVHGDCWDGNTAVDAETGEAFIFDVCTFYAHNEYDIGNWRAPRHVLSDPAYLNSYFTHMPKSEPVEDWPLRHILYSLPYNIGNAAFVPDSVQKPVIYEDMTYLCDLFCPEEYQTEMNALLARETEAATAGLSAVALDDDTTKLSSEEDEEEEEEEDEEEEEEGREEDDFNRVNFKEEGRQSFSTSDPVQVLQQKSRVRVPIK